MMDPEQPYEKKKLLAYFRKSLSTRFSLLEDKAANSVIDENIHSGIELRGATPWILMFAILTASIGLNVNSTAIIIGAMLISPLMGPVMGIGYGVGIYDFPLIKKSLLNLGIAALISLLTSTVYFAIRPLSQAHSEILARTAPTLWDVLVAFFGGFAGIIGATRKEKSNVIPGVAIATALMPPLCTAGYGLANGHWSFFFGALYLFFINCVFIAYATVLVISFFKIPHKEFVNFRTESKIKKSIAAILIITVLPSMVLAYNLVREEIFNSRAESFIKTEFSLANVFVSNLDINPKERKIEVSVVGKKIDTETLKMIEGHLALSGLDNTALVVHQTDDDQLDVTSLKAGILSDLYRDSLQALSTQQDKISELQKSIDRIDALRARSSDVARELKAQYPQFYEVIVAEGTKSMEDASRKDDVVFVLVAKTKNPVSASEKKRIENWFQVRMKTSSVHLVIES